MLRTVAAVALLVLPAGRTRQRIVRSVAGWNVDPTAKIGWSWIRADHVNIAAGVRIGSANIIKGLRELQLDEGAVIGGANSITGVTQGLFPHSPDRLPALIMGTESAITNRHRLSCSDCITFQPMSNLGGNGSLILTHGVDFERSVQRTAPVTIGRTSVVMARATILPGANIPARTLIAAGSTVTAAPMKELTMYGGVPAKPVKELSADLGFFNRPRGQIE